jgi:hypothetical protein
MNGKPWLLALCVLLCLIPVAVGQKSSPKPEPAAPSRYQLVPARGDSLTGEKVSTQFLAGYADWESLEIRRVRSTLRLPEQALFSSRAALTFSPCAIRRRILGCHHDELFHSVEQILPLQCSFHEFNENCIVCHRFRSAQVNTSRVW